MQDIMKVVTSGGNNTKKWKGKDYTGPTGTCKAVRIRSVYGEEIAGGFTGLMESADTASTGNLSLVVGTGKSRITSWEHSVLSIRRKKIRQFTGPLA